jgi:hypothetical protein
MPVSLSISAVEWVRSVSFSKDGATLISAGEDRSVRTYEMVYLDRDAATARLVHESCGVLDRLRPVHFRSLRPGRSAGDVDGRSGRTELHGYPSTRSSGRSGDQCNLACQRCLHGLSPIIRP